MAMTTEIIECEQGSPQWIAARLGIPTCSMFKAILATGKGGGDSKTRRTYMLNLAGELLTGEPAETYSNDHMARGQAMEAQARDMYALTHDIEPERVGFIKGTMKNGFVGCSPDSLVGTTGMLEIKTTLPRLLIELHESGQFPPEHKAQCQGGLWLAKREWIDLMVYWPRMPLFIQRMRRDEAYISALESAVREFNDELAYTVGKMRRLG